MDDLDQTPRKQTPTYSFVLIKGVIQAFFKLVEKMIQLLKL